MSPANIAHLPDVSLRKCFEAIVRRHHTLASLLLSFWAVCFSVLIGDKEFPGGPFVSVFGDLLPLLCAWLAFRLALRDDRHDPPGQRAIAFLTAAPAVGAATLIGFSIYAFSRSPFAQGNLLGW